MKIESSPFQYGTTVSNNCFTNREEEMAKLISNLTLQNNTMLISPRRWGKSSLVEKSLLEIGKTHKKIHIVSLDLFSVSSQREFLALFARQVIKASSNKWQDWMNTGKEFFKQVVPKLSVGVDPNSDFSVSFDFAALDKYPEEILNLPEAIGTAKNSRFIICIDEFQSLSDFKEYQKLEKIMRAVWQRQKQVTYCLYGSKRHMMTDIFDNPAKPFYRFGDIIMLPKIERENWAKFIVSGFKRTSKFIAIAHARLIADLMKNHSWYVQQLSHYTWQKTKTKADSAHVKAALAELVQANSPLYIKEIETISKTQIYLLKAIAQGESKLTSTSVIREYRLGTPRNVSKNRDKLIQSDTIHLAEGIFEFLDPAFELWFKKVYFNQDFLDF